LRSSRGCVRGIRFWGKSRSVEAIYLSIGVRQFQGARRQPKPQDFMKRLNIKLVVCLVVITVVAVVGGYFAHAFQYGAATEGSRQKAEDLKKEGKRSEALQEYLSYIHQKDTAVDVEVLIDASKLANSIFFEQAIRENYKPANDLLRQGMRQFPENAELKQTYAELMLFTLQFDEAVEPLVWLTAPERGKHDPKFDLMLAECYIHRSYPERAVDIYSGLVGFDAKTRTFDAAKAQFPNLIEAYELLARLLRERVDPPQPKNADLVMEQLVAANKDSFRAHLLRASYLQQYAHGTGSKKDLAIALNLAPDDAEVILVAAQDAMMDGKFEQCQSLLTHGLKLFPKNVNMYRQWAVLKSNENKLGEAVAEIKQGLIVLPENPDLLWMLCEVELKHDLRAARDAHTRLKKTGFQKPLVDLMDGRILLSEGKWREAAQKFEQLRPLLAQSPEHTKQIDLFAAQCYGQLGEYDKQLEAGRRVQQMDPTSASAQLNIASALMATGKIEEAKHIYDALAAAVGKEKAIAIPQIWRPIVQFRMDEQMRLPKDKRNWSRVDAIVALLDKEDAVNGKETDKAARSAIALLKAEIELRKDNLPGARQLLLDAKAKYPMEPSVWSALATITFRSDSNGGAAAALKVLDEAPAEIRGNVVLRLNHAGILLRQGGDHVKQSILALDADSDGLPAADRARLWNGLGAALISLGDYEGAERYWLKVADVNHDDLKIRFSLLDLARDIGDEAVMSKMAEQFRTIMGVTSAEARYAEATRAVALVRKAVRQRTLTGRPVPPLNEEEKLSLASARKLLEEVRQDRSNWYETERVLGDIEVLDNNVDAAITDYQLALKLGPPNPLTIRQLVVLLSRQNKTEEVRAALDLIGPESIDEFGLGRFAVDNAAKSNDFPAAIARAKREVPDDSRDPSGHLWIAALYDRAGHTAEAEASFRRAVATGPEQPETWLRLVEHLYHYSKGDGIGEVLLDARKQLPEDRVNQVLGPGYELIGQYPQAEQYYKAALEAAPDDINTHRIVANFYMQIGRADPARKEALAVMRLAGDDPKNKPHVLWARRTMATLSAATGKYQDFVEAKALLAKNVEDSGGDSEDKLRLADLLGARTDEPSSWQQAVKLLESIKPLPASSQVKLAHFHEVLGNWSDARRDMVNFLSEQKALPAAYVVFIDMLIRHDEIADASQWLDRLDSVQPTKPGSGLTQPLVLRCRVLVKQNRTKEAVDLLKSALPSRPLPPEKMPQLRDVAMELAHLGLNAAAEDMLREYVGYEPAAKLQLASFLGRTGRLDESLDLCEASLKTYPMATIMEVAGEVFQAQPSRIEPKHIQRVEKWYQRALHDDPDSAKLLLQEARFREISGQLDDAEQIYRGLLHRSDLDSTERSIALNNLAFSLAGRKKDLADALAFINEAARLFGENSDVLDSRGMVYVAMANYPAALADLSKAVLVPEPSAVKLLHLALAQDLSGDRTDATISFERAKRQKLDPTSLRKVERDSYDRLSKDLSL
jgi:cellulose synthase operon protein C